MKDKQATESQNTGRSSKQRTEHKHKITNHWRLADRQWQLTVSLYEDLGGVCVGEHNRKIRKTKMRNADETGTLEKVEKETEVRFQVKQQQKNEQGTKTNGKKRKK